MPRTRSATLLLLSLALCLLPSVPPARAAAPAPQEDLGVLVMAHGGTEEWNRNVQEAVAPLAGSLPISVAFGMADADALQHAVHELEAAGVRRIVVVRLFISGDSWLERTEQILGLTPGAPPAPPTSAHPHPAAADAASPAGDQPPAGDPGARHQPALYRIRTDSAFALSREGLSEAAEVGRILLERARDLSATPEREQVLILAHGVGDDAENARWRDLITARAAQLRDALPFRRVQIETLAEDWPEQRVAAEERVRAFVRDGAAGGEQTIVIPFRLSGFGPYAKILEGIDYVSDGRGLLPHSAITEWIRRQIEELRSGPFREPVETTAPA